MEKVEIFTAKSMEEIKELAAEKFGADASDIEFEIIEQPVKKLFGSKGEFRVRAIYEDKSAVVNKPTAPAKSVTSAKPTVTAKTSAPAGKLIEDPAELAKFKPIIEYLEKILSHLGAKGYNFTVRRTGDNNIINIDGDGLGAIIGRRGETLDALQYLAILANNRGSDEGARLRLLVDCNGYREKRAETLEALAVRTASKVIKQGRRVTLEPMNPYERRVIHSKVAEIDGVFSGSIGEEPYRKVVISAEVVKRRTDRPQRDNRDSRNSGRRDNQRREPMRRDSDVIPQRIPGEVSNTVHSKSYKQSSGFSTSFEREYKRSLNEETDISQDTVDVEKSATLYGKIEL